MAKKTRKMAVTKKDVEIAELVEKTDKKTLVTWACDCAERALPHFENNYPGDNRPRQAIEVGRAWIRTGVFNMSVVMGASLGAHASARDVEEDDPARSAARAAGQAVAAAHARKHSIAAAIYAATAVRDSTPPDDSEAATLQEREWQLKHLLELAES